MDMGNLLFEDCTSYTDMTTKEFMLKTAQNICSVYRGLFELKGRQDAKHGEDGEILEYMKSTNTIQMPAGHTTLPREKPCPVEEAKTKWEKFREERGMAPRKKRSRLVFDPI